MAKPIEEKQKMDAIRLYQESNLSVVEISTITGISASAIHKLLKNEGIHTRKTMEVTEQMLNIAVKLYEDGFTVQDINEMTKVPVSKMYEEIDRRGIERRKEMHTRIKPKKINEQEVFDAYENNLSISEIAKQMGISTNSVSRIISKAQKEGIITISERYAEEKWKDEFYPQVARIILQNKTPVSVREISKVMNLDEKKMYHVVQNMRNTN